MDNTEPRHVTEKRLMEETGLSRKAVEVLLDMKQQGQDDILSIISSLILSDVSACILSAVWTKRRSAYIYHGKDKPCEYISADTVIALQKMMAQESLYAFIDKARKDNGLDPIERGVTE